MTMSAVKSKDCCVHKAIHDSFKNINLLNTQKILLQYKLAWGSEMLSTIFKHKDKQQQTCFTAESLTVTTGSQLWY